MSAENEAIATIVREELRSVTHTTELMSDGKVRVKLNLIPAAIIIWEQRQRIEALKSQIDVLEDDLFQAHDDIATLKDVCANYSQER